MRQTRFIFILLFFTFLSGVSAQISATWQRKADALYHNREWGEMVDMYDKMLLKYPQLPQMYIRPIIAASKLRTPQLVMRYIETSEKNGVPLDTLFLLLEEATRELGDAPIYERTLALVKDQQPWFSRIINIKLLDFYLARRQWDNAVHIINNLLQTTPDDIYFMQLKAKAFAEGGREDSAVVAHEKVLKLDNYNRDANIYLGNYYFLTGHEKLSKLKKEYDSLVSPDRMQYLSHQKAQKEVLTKQYAKAAEYLEKEDAVRSTPYLRKTLYEIYVQQSDAKKADVMKSRLSQ